jgi:hypothetical protein
MQAVAPGTMNKLFVDAGTTVVTLNLRPTIVLESWFVLRVLAVVLQRTHGPQALFKLSPWPLGCKP